MSEHGRILTILYFKFSALLLLFFIASATAQTQQKVLLWSDHPMGNHNERGVPPLQVVKKIDAIEIQSITIGGRSIAIGEPFPADNDWLRDMTFRIKNISGQELAGVQVTLTLPEMQSSPYIPYIAGCKHDKNQPCIQPGVEVELKIVGGSLYEWVKRRVATETEMPKITKAAIKDVLVLFPGESKLSSGCVKTKDPRQACPEHVH